MFLASIIGLLSLLTIGEVGPDVMPETIEPVEAPFPMPQFERPVFPQLTVTVRMNAKGLSTSRIQKAIDNVSRKGGGTVEVPAGVWKTGRIELKSNVNLRLAEGCELHFSGEVKDYLPAVLTRDEGIDLYSLGACIYANGQENIALTGKGRVVGPSVDCEIYKKNLEFSSDRETHLPLERRIFDGRDSVKVALPKTFAPIHCKKIFVEGVTFDKGLYWNVVPQYCEDVIIRGITVTSHGHGRTDGIDIESTRNVLIEYCSLDCQDDCYTMKSGRGEDGLKVNRITENVVVRKSVALRGAGGIVCGTETAGGVRNVYMADCVFEGTDQAFRFKTRRPRGGFVENILVERIRANVRKQALFVDMLGSATYVGKLADRYPARDIVPLTPWFSNISIHDVEITNCRDLVSIKGLPEIPIKNLFFGNVKAKCGTLGKVYDTDKFTMKDVAVETVDTALVIDNCNYASFFNFTNVSTGSPVKIVVAGGDCRYLDVQTFPMAGKR